MAFTTFLDSAAKGRVKAYEQKENEKIQKWNVLNNFMANNVWNNSNIMPEAMTKAGQIYAQAMGHYAQDAVSGGGQVAGQDQTETTKGIQKLVKGVATSLTGGKNPKGAPDPGDAMLKIQALLFDQNGLKDEHNLKTAETNAFQSLQKLAPTDTSTPQEQVQRTLQSSAPFADAQKRFGQEKANAMLGQVISPYQPAPRPGSAEWQTVQREQRNAEWAKERVGGRTEAPPEPVRSIAGLPATAQIGLAGPPQESGVVPGPPEAAATYPKDIHPTGFRMSDQHWQDAVTEGRVSKDDDWETADGTRILGNVVNVPGGGPAFFSRDRQELGLDVNRLFPYQGRTDVRLVNPKNQNETKDVWLDKSLGMYIDKVTGLLADPAIRSWEQVPTNWKPPVQFKGENIYDPNNPSKSTWVIYDPNTHERFLSPGVPAPKEMQNWKTGNPPRPMAPDRFMEHFKVTLEMRDQHDAEQALKQADNKYYSEIQTLRRQANGEIAGIDKNPDIKEADKQTKKTEVEERLKAENTALKTMYEEHVGRIKNEWPNAKLPSTSDPKPDKDKPSGASTLGKKAETTLSGKDKVLIP
jgi:hypothetical protein